MDIWRIFNIFFFFVFLIFFFTNFVIYRKSNRKIWENIGKVENNRTFNQI
jgi:tellurite resistance protein TehA-like permease